MAVAPMVDGMDQVDMREAWVLFRRLRNLLRQKEGEI
jgi:hypothetical protein